MTMLLPIVVRLAMFSTVPAPRPYAHDEFGHILNAETMLAGRLANPPHPLSKYFETIYVIQHPTYASNYPLGQGIILAVGQGLIGHPWAGVLLAVALMCGAITWMLYGGLPPEWAAFGGVLASMHFGLYLLWINSYWGGAFCAFGGALLFGAICRLTNGHSPTLALAVCIGFGWSIVWLTRPYEAIALCILFWAMLALLFFRSGTQKAAWIVPLLSILMIQAGTGGLTALHNHAVSGSYTTLPYQLNQRIYGVPQTLLWQKPVEEPPLAVPSQKAMYKWQRDKRDQALLHPLDHAKYVFGPWQFYVLRWYAPALLLALLVLRRERFVFWGVLAITIALLWSLPYPFMAAHYLAAYSGLIFFLILRGTMMMSRYTYRNWPIGAMCAVFTICGATMVDLGRGPLTLFRGVEPGSLKYREVIADRLTSMGGQHVVLVRLGPHQNLHREWIFNAAQVDAAPVVWARVADTAGASEVMQYYKDRKAWVAFVEGRYVRFSQYHPDREFTHGLSDPEALNEWDWSKDTPNFQERSISAPE